MVSEGVSEAHCRTVKAVRKKKERKKKRVLVYPVTSASLHSAVSQPPAPGEEPHTPGHKEDQTHIFTRLLFFSYFVKETLLNLSFFLLRLSVHIWFLLLLCVFSSSEQHFFFLAPESVEIKASTVQSTDFLPPCLGYAAVRFWRLFTHLTILQIYMKKTNFETSWYEVIHWGEDPHIPVSTLQVLNDDNIDFEYA